MYELLKKTVWQKEGGYTVHGTIETPVFMNVGTAAAIKGEPYQQMISVRLKRRLNCQIHITFMSDRGMKS